MTVKTLLFNGSGLPFVKGEFLSMLQIFNIFLVLCLCLRPQVVYVPVPAAADPYSEPDPYEDEPEGYPEMAMQAVYPAPKKSGKGGAYGGRGKRSLYGYRGGFGRFGGFGYPFVSFAYLFQFKFTL